MLDLFNKKKLKEKETIIEAKRKKITELLDTIDNLTEQNTRITTNSEHLIEENRKLIDWIERILDTVGIMEIREKLNFRIPVYIEKEYKAYDRNVMGIFEKERITIPEITIIKMG